MLHCSGNYQATLSAQYGLLLPVEWLAAFPQHHAVLCYEGNHWKLYPVRDWAVWQLLLNSMYEPPGDPLPAALKEQIKTAQEVRLTPAGEIIIPPALRLLPPGPVQIVARENFVEVWPLAVWFEEEEKRLAVAMTMEEFLKTVEKYPPAPLNRLPPDN